MTPPGDRRYTDQHEWVLPTADGFRVGITEYAQDALGDVVFVDLPEVGRVVTAGDTIAEVESTKSLAEVYAPCAGTIVAVNSELAARPELINADPYGEAWFVEFTADDPSCVEALLASEEYAALIA